MEVHYKKFQLHRSEALQVIIVRSPPPPRTPLNERRGGGGYVTVRTHNYSSQGEGLQVPLLFPIVHYSTPCFYITQRTTHKIIIVLTIPGNIKLLQDDIAMLFH